LLVVLLLLLLLLLLCVFLAAFDVDQTACCLGAAATYGDLYRAPAAAAEAAATEESWRLHQ
jgi:hypothetical protein